MTKKDYELIATCFSLNKPYNFPSDGLTTYDEGLRKGKNQMWTDLVYDMANGLRGTGQRFDRAKFYTACGIED